MSEQPRTPTVTPFTERIVPGRFDGLTCIVTGAASGIGRATTLRLAREGARVVAADWSAEALEALVTEHGGLGLVPVRGNVDDEDDVAAVIAACEGDLYGLVNNAGIMDEFQPIGEVSDELWDRIQGVNVRGLMRMTRAAIPLMRERGGGSVVNLTSMAGLSGAAAGVAYTASKHAVIGITRNTAFMYAEQSIRCNAVAPGGVQTNIGAKFSSELGAQRLGPVMATNMPSVATPEALAATITYLLSPDAANNSGSVVTCDGGWDAI